MSTVASWRLERGIWTSPGAGDLRRAVAACERLVMMASSEVGGQSLGTSHERRDLAVLLLHLGDLPRAQAELSEYMRSGAFRHHCDPFDRQLTLQVADALRSSLAGSAIVPAGWVVDTQAILAMGGAPPGEAPPAKPLTW